MRLRLPSGENSTTMDSAVGMNPPPPMPTMSLPTSSTSGVGATAHSSMPSEKTVTVAR